MCQIFAFCLLGLVMVARSVDSCEEASSSHSVASTSLEEIGKILDLYNRKMFAQSDWQDFSQSINNLHWKRDSFPSESRGLVNVIVDKLRNSVSQHASATRSIESWCESSRPELQTYKALFDGNYSQDKAESQRTILVDLLKKGVEKLSFALDQLNDCIRNLNAASGDIVQVDNQVERARRREINELEARKQNMRNTQWWAFIFPILGVTLTLTNELDAIPRIDSRIGELQNLYNQLNGIIRNVENDIKSGRDELQREIITLNNLQCQAKVTRTFIELSVPIKVLIKKHATNLIEKCTSYESVW